MFAKLMALMVSRAPAILPVPEVGTRRMAKEYCLAFSARPTNMRLRLPTMQLIRLLYGDLTKLMYLATLVELEGSILPEYGESINALLFFLGRWLDPEVLVVVLVLRE
jgi:hypothetical protein